MKRILTTAILVVSLIGFIYLGLANINKTNHKVKIQDIQLKSKQSDLLDLEKKFNILNKELEQKNLDEKKVQELEQQKADLQKQLEQAQHDLQAKAEQKKAQQEKLARAATLSSQPVYASTGCSDAKSCIYFHESGNRTNAINASSGACGLGQAWPCSKMPCSLSDYACQDAFFTNYALTRYGSWDAAWAYWQGHSNW